MILKIKHHVLLNTCTKGEPIYPYATTPTPCVSKYLLTIGLLLVFEPGGTTGGYLIPGKYNPRTPSLPQTDPAGFLEAIVNGLYNIGLGLLTGFIGILTASHLDVVLAAVQVTIIYS